MPLQIFMRNNIFNDNNVKDDVVNLKPHYSASIKREWKPSNKCDKPIEPIDVRCSDCKPASKIFDEGFFDYCTPYDGKSDVQIWRELNELDDSLLDTFCNMRYMDMTDEEDYDESGKLHFRADSLDDSNFMLSNDSALGNEDDFDLDISLQLSTILPNPHHDYFID